MARCKLAHVVSLWSFSVFLAAACNVSRCCQRRELIEETTRKARRTHGKGYLGQRNFTRHARPSLGRCHSSFSVVFVQACCLRVARVGLSRSSPSSLSSSLLASRGLLGLRDSFLRDRRSLVGLRRRGDLRLGRRRLSLSLLTFNMILLSLRRAARGLAGDGVL